MPRPDELRAEADAHRARAKDLSAQADRLEQEDAVRELRYALRDYANALLFDGYGSENEVRANQRLTEARWATYGAVPKGTVVKVFS